MSLRSGSPCTSTSRPSCSCRSTTRPISARISSSYSAAVSLPAPNAARAARISGVCGNEPIVVVGRAGSCSRASWAARRSSNEPRWNCSAVSAATRSRTSGRTTPPAAARAARASAAARSASWIASRPSVRPSARVTTSTTFWSAKASQDASDGSRFGSSATSCGVWNREVEVPTATAAAPSVSSCSSVDRAPSRSARQMLWPSITPPTRVFVSRPATEPVGRSPRTRSIARPSTAVRASTGSAAPRSPYGAATRIAGRSVASPSTRYASSAAASSRSVGTPVDSDTSAGSSSCTQVAPAARSAASSSTYTGSTSARRSIGAKPSGAPSAAFASARNVTGPTSTGRVSTPSASASANSCTGRSPESRNSVSGPISGTR